MAAGDSLVIWTPQSNQPTSSNAATEVVRNQHLVLSFAESTTVNQNAVFAAIMPNHYASTGGGGVTAFLQFAVSTATTGTVDLDVAFERIGEEGQDIDSDGFAAANSVDGTTAPATSGHLKIASVAFTDGADMDSVVAGDAFRVKVTRDTLNDSIVGGVQLWGVELRETS